MSRELNSLYLENQQLPVSLDLFQAKPSFSRSNAQRWTWRGFKSSARADDLKLHHWVKADEKYDDYFYARFNAQPTICQYTDDEYDKWIKPLDKSWSRAETDYLLRLCKQFDLRFLVIQDRYYTHPEFPSGDIVSDRTLEDLKDRYYTVCRTLTQHRAGEDSWDPDDVPLQATNKLADDLALLRFDKSKEEERKRYLEALFARSKEEIDEEEMLIVEARRIEANERRMVYEREMLLQSHAMFEDAPNTSSSIPPVKVQFAQAFESLQSASTPGDVTPRIRKAGSDLLAADNVLGGRTPKKQRNNQGAASRTRTPTSNKGSSSQKRVLSPSVNDKKSNRRSASPMRSGSVGVKYERLDGPTQFGPVSFATEEHLIHPAVIQVETPEMGVMIAAQRDTKLGPGVFLRSDKLFPIPKNKLDPVKQFMSQLDLSSPNTIWPRPVMATAAVCDRFDSLQSTIVPLLDHKKIADKLETEIQVLRARKRMLTNNVGEEKAKQVLDELPPFDESTVSHSRRATTPSTARMSPVAGGSGHRKNSSVSSSRKRG